MDYIDFFDFIDFLRFEVVYLHYRFGLDKEGHL
jgi:hypothetical protein